MELNLLAGEKRYLTDLKEAATKTLRPFRFQVETERRIPEAVTEELARLALPGANGFSEALDDAPTASAFCLAAEALGWGEPSIAYSWLVSRQVAWVISEAGSPEQKAKWLSRFAGDPLFPASLYLQEGRGAPPSELETTVLEKGDSFRVDGFKSPVFNPTTAEVSVVVGRDASGKLRAVLMEDRGDRVLFSGLQERRLALSGCSVALEAQIEGLEVPAENVLPGDVSRAISVCRLSHAALCLGIAGAATRYAGEWARTRVAFGKPIIGHQGVSFPLADLVMAADALRLSIQDLLLGDLPADELERQTNHIVAEANQVVQDAGREGVQTMGVHGIISDHPASHWYKAAAVVASVDYDPLTSRLKFV
ncbi:acyl-CoA dehydrogenase [Aliidongia dinghuensis]|uniref:Acyl-CoA dehydrogenase n=1 Tax=Aliidongia dinghuensis TaxID=1867774 RepID=A0A8J2Z1H9_9PROT|nr:acyl-CoA dehydrogenase family protein [Aliidongia dinghuensis]GGF49456.1 acyl-CoA dehydrogenase [Aliidongia dinghuensis]